MSTHTAQRQLAHLMTDAELNREADAVAMRMARGEVQRQDAFTVIELSSRLIRATRSAGDYIRFAGSTS